MLSGIQISESERLPSSPATRTLAHALPPRNFQVDVWRLSPGTAHAPSVREERGPAHRPAPAGCAIGQEAEFLHMRIAES